MTPLGLRIIGISLVCLGGIVASKPVTADHTPTDHTCTFTPTSPIDNTGIEVCTSSSVSGYANSTSTSDGSISQGDVYYRYKHRSCVCKNIEVRDNTSRSWCKCDREKYRHVLPQNVD